MVDGPDNAWRNRAPGPPRNTARQAMDGLWTEVCGQQKQSNDPGNNQHILNTPIIGQTAHHATFSTAPTHQLLLPPSPATIYPHHAKMAHGWPSGQTFCTVRTMNAVPLLTNYPPCVIPSGCCSFSGPWTVTRSSLRMLRRVSAFCRPLRPVLLLVSFPRSRSPV